ncbi:MAG: HEPN domain-containing protein [Agrobacterium cavarae]
MEREDDKMLLAALYEASSYALETDEDLVNPHDAGTAWGKLRLALEAHSIFGKGRQVFAGRHQLNLSPMFVAMVAGRFLRRRGPEDTLKWLHHIFTIENIESRRCAELIGVKIGERLTLSNGVNLVPFNEMRSSWHTDALRYSHTAPRSMMASFPYDVIGMYQIVSLKFSPDIKKYEDNYQGFIEASLAVSAVAGCAAVVGAVWSEYEYVDYEDAELGRSHIPASYEGRSPRFQDVTLTALHLEDINRFLELAGRVKKSCLTASARLNSARRRVTAGDSAIDLATALEALLATSDERSEITYRLKLRAAIMLGDSLEERENIFRRIGELYKLRSNVVHGSLSTHSDATDTATVNWATDACSRLLTKVVRAGRMPDLQKLVLIGSSEAAFS